MSDTSDIFSPRDGDLIVLKVDPSHSPLEIETRQRSLREALDKLGHERVAIIIVSSEDDVKLLRESDMRKLGWTRIRR